MKSSARRLLTVALVAATSLTPTVPALAKAAAKRAAATRPNVVVIVLDDVGFADIGVFGSEIATPNIDALARDGLRYNRFDSRAICSATRASLLTGRNNQTVRMEDLAGLPKVPNPADESASKGEMPLNAETMPQALHAAGYTTIGIGKWHLSPNYDEAPGQNQRSWPLQRGFDQFYGFLSGWTDQYKPTLVEGNRHIPSPTQAGYHFSVDITDQAIRRWNERRTAAPAKPRFLYLAYGAGHSPLQVPRAYIDRYKGMYDQGWDALRAARFDRQKALGIVPANTVLPERNVGDAAWATLDPQRKRVFARFMETYAGFLTHTDEQIGRLVASLKESGEYDNTLFVFLSDNGAASEGGPDGAFKNHYGDTTPITEMDANLDKLGGPELRPLYQRPWAMAGVTPFRRYKLWPYAGGLRTPLIVTWKQRIRAGGAIRMQPVDTIDLAPTILEAAGTRFHDTVAGVKQIPVAGRSIAPTFASATAPTRPVQFFELRGNRAIRAGKWRAVAMHRIDTDFAQDRWQLFDTSTDFAEATDLSARHPAKLAELKALWAREAARYSDPVVTNPVPMLYKFNRMEDAFRENAPE
jgi:arylsulfatase